MGYALAAAARSGGAPRSRSSPGPPRSRRRRGRPSCPCRPPRTCARRSCTTPAGDASSSRRPPWPTTGCGGRPTRRSRASAISRSSSRPIPTSWPRWPPRATGGLHRGLRGRDQRRGGQRAGQARGQGHRPARRQRREPPRHRLRRRGQRGAADRPLGRQPRAAADAEVRGSRRHPRRHPRAARELIPRARRSAERRSAGGPGRRPRRPGRHAALPPRPRQSNVWPIERRLLAVAGRGLRAQEARLQGCQRCKLCAARNTIVFGSGNPEADLVVIGEGPRRRRGRAGATVRRPRRSAAHQDAGVGEAHARRGLHHQHGQVPPARQPQSRGGRAGRVRAVPGRASSA